jgi:hypothetical protein
VHALRHVADHLIIPLDMEAAARRMAGEVGAAKTYAQVRSGMGDDCKTVGSAYDGSNPTPATTSENGPWPAHIAARGLLLLA